MDSSLLLLPNLQILDLTSNNIGVIQNLHRASHLTELVLSYNSIESLSPLRECPGRLKRLILQAQLLPRDPNPSSIDSVLVVMPANSNL